MAFSFEKFGQRSTRGLFAFIVVIMVVPLVLWGYMGDQSEREQACRSLDSLRSLGMTTDHLHERHKAARCAAS